MAENVLMPAASRNALARGRIRPAISDQEWIEPEGRPSAMDAFLMMGAPGLGAAVRGVGGAMTAFPRATATAAGLAGVTVGATAAGDSLSGGLPAINLDPYYKQQQQIMDEIRSQQQIREQNKPAGTPRRNRDTNYFKAQDRIEQLQSDLTAINTQIRDLSAQNTPAARQKAVADAARLADEEAKRRAALPWRQRNPELAENLPYAGLVAAGVMPFMLKGGSNAASYLWPASPASRLNRSISQGMDALKGGDPIARGVAERELTNRIAGKPTEIQSRLGEVEKAGLAALAGGGIAAEAQLFPDQYDAFNPLIPEGSPLKEAAKERALSMWPYLERGAVGALTGLSGYKMGQLVPKRAPDYPRAEAVRDTLAQGGRSAPPNAGPTPPPAAGAQQKSAGPSSPSQSPPSQPASDDPMALFRSKYGRDPVSETDWAEVLGRTAVAVPLTAGAAAAGYQLPEMYNALMPRSY